MPLYIRDDTVDDLANRVRLATGAKSKTDAVREALQARLDEVRDKTPLLERIREIQSLADAIGDPDPEFDMKAFSDNAWGNA